MNIKAIAVFLILLSGYLTGRAQLLLPGDGGLSDTLAIHHTKNGSHVKKKWPEFHYPGKQYFFEGEAVIGFVDAGVRFIAGYRLGQFGIIGGGIGADWNLIPLTNNSSVDPYNGFYFPVFAHYEGDILKKRVTPYYAVEAGYGFRYTNSSNNDYIVITPAVNEPDHPVYKYYDGFTGAFDFGAKLYARHKVYACWALTLNVQQGTDKYSDSFYNSLGQNIKVSYNSYSFIWVPGVKIACGF